MSQSTNKYALIEIPSRNKKIMIVSTEEIIDFHKYNVFNKNKMYHLKEDGKLVKCGILNIAGKI